LQSADILKHVLYKIINSHKDMDDLTVSPIDDKKHRPSNVESRSSFVHLHKSTEKIVAALFLITELMSDNNPIRLKIRTLGVDLVSFILSSSTSIVDDVHFFNTRYTSLLLEILSLLEIALLSEQISHMNFRIISEEINRIGEVTDKLKKRYGSTALSSRSARILTRGKASQKATDSLLSASDRFGTQISSSGLHKGHSIRHRKSLVSYRKMNNRFDIQAIDTVKRKEIIVNSLKDGKHLTTKDFMSVIGGVSDKTIQRDLISMVKDGTLRKEGERRWSRYFLSLPTPLQ